MNSSMQVKASPENWQVEDVIKSFTSVDLSTYVVLVALLIIIAKVKQLCMSKSSKTKSQKRKRKSEEPKIVPDAKFGDWMTKVSEAVREGKPISEELIDQDVKERIKGAHDQLDGARKRGVRMADYNYQANEMYYTEVARAAKQGLNKVTIPYDQLGVKNGGDRYSFGHGDANRTHFFSGHNIDHNDSSTCTPPNECSWMSCPHRYIALSWPKA